MRFVRRTFDPRLCAGLAPMPPVAKVLADRRRARPARRSKILPMETEDADAANDAIQFREQVRGWVGASQGGAEQGRSSSKGATPGSGGGRTAASGRSGFPAATRSRARHRQARPRHQGRGPGCAPRGHRGGAAAVAAAGGARGRLDRSGGRPPTARRRVDASRMRANLVPFFGHQLPDEVTARRTCGASSRGKLAAGLSSTTVGHCVGSCRSSRRPRGAGDRRRELGARAPKRSTRRLYRNAHDPRTTPFLERQEDIAAVYRAPSRSRSPRSSWWACWRD